MECNIDGILREASLLQETRATNASVFDFTPIYEPVGHGLDLVNELPPRPDFYTILVYD